MQVYACLTGVAQIELDALLREAQCAIEGLERQRQSATQAIEAARRASEQDKPQALEAVILELELVDKLRRLEAALDHVMDEIEGITPPPSTVYRLPLQRLNAARGRRP